MKTIMEWEPDLGKTSIDVFELLDWVIGYLSDLGLVKEPNRLLERLMDREAAGSTLVGINLANPHAQLSEVSECLIFYIKLCDPILNWDGRHDVDRILVTLLPEKPDGRDLVRLRMLYRRMADEAFMNVLQSGTDTDVQQILLAEGK